MKCRFSKVNKRIKKEIEGMATTLIDQFGVGKVPPIHMASRVRKIRSRCAKSNPAENYLESVSFFYVLIGHKKIKKPLPTSVQPDEDPEEEGNEFKEILGGMNHENHILEKHLDNFLEKAENFLSLSCYSKIDDFIYLLRSVQEKVDNILNDNETSLSIASLKELMPLLDAEADDLEQWQDSLAYNKLPEMFQFFLRFFWIWRKNMALLFYSSNDELGEYLNIKNGRHAAKKPGN